MERLLTVALVVTAACYDPHYDDRTRCGNGSECPSGRTCHDGVCLVTSPDAPLAAFDAASPVDGAASVDGAAASGDAGGTIAITVNKVGTGDGSIMANGMICGPGCTQLVIQVPASAMDLAIDAVPAPGAYFQGWDGGCTTVARRCTVDRTTSRTVDARFATRDANLMFVSSVPVMGNLGAQNVNAVCTTLASNAGLTGEWRTLVAAPGVDLLTRLIYAGDDALTARGFTRMDGAWVADGAENLVNDHRVWNAILFNEKGEMVRGRVWTGATSSGDVSTLHCNGWKSSEVTMQGSVGNANGGATLTSVGEAGCSQSLPVICTTVDKRVAAPALPAPQPKQIFISSMLVRGTSSADAFNACAADRSGAMPLLALTTASAASTLLSGTTLYSRPDGVLLGTGQEIAARGPRTGIWVQATGAPSLMRNVWSGSPSYFTPPLTTQNCASFSAGGTTGFIGTPTGDGDWWSIPGPQPCTNQYAVYCYTP